MGVWELRVSAFRNLGIKKKHLIMAADLIEMDATIIVGIKEYIACMSPPYKMYACTYELK